MIQMKSMYIDDDLNFIINLYKLLGLASAAFRRTFDTEDDPDIDAEEATNLLENVKMPQQPNLMSFEDFQRLPTDKQSEEIFKLLSMLSPFASEVSSLRSSMESALNRISDLEAKGSTLQPNR